MPSIYFNKANYTTCELLSVNEFEKFINDSHNDISSNLHEKLLDFHASIDSEVCEKIDGLIDEISDLKSDLEELKKQLEQTEV